MSRVAGGSNTPTRPLQISRPSSSRPTTPSSAAYSPRTGSFPNMNNNAHNTNGPSRPQRSELRHRNGSVDLDGSISSMSSRDYPQDISSPRSAADSARSPGGTSRRAQLASPTSPNSQTPKAMNSVMSAFRDAAVRQRAPTSPEDVEYQRNRQQEIEMENKRQQRIRDKVGARRINGKTRAGDIDAILDQIKDEWEFVVDPDFNNVDLALQLLDESSQGKNMQSFQNTKHMLSRALKGSVDKHYHAFNASLGHHASLISHLGETQAQITDTKTSLAESKEALGSKRADLVQLWSRGQTLEEMLRILDQIEHLKSVPDVLETLMSEKRLLQAAVLLVRSLKTINKADMLEIGAIADLRSYLDGQETALREILIDELHSHLYLKSFWCESRWAAYTPNQQTMPKVEFDAEVQHPRLASPDAQTSPVTPSFRSTRLNTFLNNLSVRPNDPPHDLEEALPSAPTISSSLSSASVPSFPSNVIQAAQNANPELDSFAYMETLLESMAVLGRLGNALDNIAQRVPSEIYTLVDTTLDEVEERAEYGRKGSTFTANGTGHSGGAYIFASGDSAPGLGLGLPTGGLLSPSSLRLAALEASSKAADHETLRDFFWTVYSKLDAVAQGLRVIYEVTLRIAARRDFKDVSGDKPGALFPLADIWTPVHAEVRNLLYDYLTDEEQSSVSGRNPISSINEVLRDNKFTRDKTKPVFRFADTDMKLTNKLLKRHEEELTRVMKDTMPGLVQASSENQVQTALAAVGTDDRLLGSGQHHRLLIRPDAFHVSVLFRPTLSYMDHVASALPSGTVSAQSGSEVLDDFVLKVYLPQLEEKVSTLFHQAVTGSDAFQPDPASARISHEPLIKASTQLMALINSLCDMLRTTPFHRENYSRLILGVIIQFYQRCSDRFQDLVSTKSGEHEPLPSLAAQWAQRSELQPCLAELLATPSTDATKLLQLSRQETHLELDFLEQGTVSQADLVLSIRNLSAMGSLYRSLSWFVTHLSLLNSNEEGPLSPTPSTVDPMSSIPPHTPYLPVVPTASTVEPLQLALSKEMAMRFQALLKTYDHLAELILISIRIDVRCRTIHYLDTAMRYGNYTIDREPNEPDAHVIDLNTDLGRCDQLISGTLPKKEQQFIFAGLGHLMEHLLVANARHLRLVNAFGIKKILRNMLALQQSIRTITNGVQNTEFTRAKEYYSLFFMTPTEMLDSIRTKRSFNFEEYETMLALQCGVNRAAGDAGVADATDRNFSMYVIDLHGLELENSSS